MVLWRVPWLARPADARSVCSAPCASGTDPGRAAPGARPGGSRCCWSPRFALFATPMWSAKTLGRRARPPHLEASSSTSGDRILDQTDLDRPQGLLLAPKTIMRHHPDRHPARSGSSCPATSTSSSTTSDSSSPRTELLLAGFADGAASPTPVSDVDAVPLDRLDVGHHLRLQRQPVRPPTPRRSWATEEFATSARRRARMTCFRRVG